MNTNSNPVTQDSGDVGNGGFGARTGGETAQATTGCFNAFEMKLPFGVSDLLDAKGPIVRSSGCGLRFRDLDLASKLARLAAGPHADANPISPFSEKRIEQAARTRKIRQAISRALGLGDGAPAEGTSSVEPQIPVAPKSDERRVPASDNPPSQHPSTLNPQPSTPSQPPTPDSPGAIYWTNPTHIPEIPRSSDPWFYHSPEFYVPSILTEECEPSRLVLAKCREADLAAIEELKARLKTSADAAQPSAPPAPGDNQSSTNHT